MGMCYQNRKLAEIAIHYEVIGQTIVSVAKFEWQLCTLMCIDVGTQLLLNRRDEYFKH